jgi:penicillin amidase
LPAEVDLPGLRSPVEVAWDQAGVPHFFAEDEADLYRAQGFVMASQRLFQMDLATRQTAGRLSEWVGNKTLKSDRFYVSLGLRESANETLERFIRDPRSKLMMTSFVEGVNAYIRGMTQLPPEYVLLGVRPELWDLKRIIYMDKSLSFSLSGRSFATYLSALQQQLGTAAVLDLFPEFLPSVYEDFIVPDRGRGPRRAPETPQDFHFVSHLKNIPVFPLPNPGKGSNNWAVAPAKSSTGHSLFANDTHLRYTLPNVWYENQLSCPEFNVYGVSLIAVPGLVNGFNSKIAWGPTNGTTGVMDWYEIEFENETSWRYKQGADWEPAVVREEEIRRAGAGPVKVNVVRTRLGVLMYREGRFGLVVNWLGDRSRQELRALRGLFAARDYKSCLHSFAHDWGAPIQNFICADADHVSLLHAGFVPRRKRGDGRFIMDGRDAPRPELAVPVEAQPRLVDPPEGYVLSANQKVEGPHYPYYLGWDYEEPFRGMMIRRRLAGKSKFSPQDMLRLQNDDYDLQAEYILPWLLKNIETDGLEVGQREALARLRHWDHRARSGANEATLYKAWYASLKEELFKSKYRLNKKDFYPKDMRVAWLLKRVSENPKDSDARWVGSQSGDSLPHIVSRAFRRAWSGLSRAYGNDPAAWTWKRYNAAAMPHVARLPGFGSDLLDMDGSADSVRGNRGDHGPVYKLVVALGDEPQAWIQVPGGNNGDPLAPDFERGVREWAQGKMRPVAFYKSAAEARDKGVRVTVLRPPVMGEGR